MEGKLYLANGNHKESYHKFIQSLAIYNNAETAMAMTMEFTQVDNHAMAYIFLQEVKEKYISQALKNDHRLAFMFNNLNSKLERDLGYQQ